MGRVRYYPQSEETRTAPLKKLEKDHKISQDEHHTRGDVLQKMTDAHVKDIDTALHAKEQEIMQV